MKNKLSGLKLALLGASAVLIAGAFSHANADELKHTGINNSDSEYSQVFQERMGKVKAHAEYVLSQNVNFGTKVNFDYATFGKAENSLGDSAVMMGDEKGCEVYLSHNKDTGFSEGLTSPENKPLIQKILGFTEAEEELRNEFVLGHEVAHCGFPNIKDPFRIKGNPDLSAQLNKVYADTAQRAIKSSNGFGEAVPIHGLADALNEAFADTTSAINLLKKYNGSDNIKVFLKKISAERELNNQITSPLDKELIDAYDLGAATKNVLKPENLERVLSTNNHNELREIAIEIANNALMTSLAKKNDKQLETALGDWNLKEQAKILVKGGDGLKKEGSLITEQINQSFNKLSAKEKAEFAETRGAYFSESGGKDIERKADRFIELTDKVVASMKFKASDITPVIESVKAYTSKIKETEKVNKSLDEVVAEESQILNLSADNVRGLQKEFKEVEAKKVSYKLSSIALK